MQQHTLSANEIKEISKVVINIVKRNKVTKLSDIQDKIRALDYPKKYSTYNNLKYVMKYVGIDKLDKQYTFVNLTENHKETKECWRCEESKVLGSYKKCYRYIREPLNICNDCIKEEHSITGESIPELNAIYEYLQYRYANTLDKSMYGKFWERALYGDRVDIMV
tara:strand:- start:234 stop:728 length:495 start_codon:yes stop_codon:yes gene_type:complete